MARVTSGTLPPLAESSLALVEQRIVAGSGATYGAVEQDTLVFVASGHAELELDGAHDIPPGTAAFVPAGREALLEARTDLLVLVATVGPNADRHAPLGQPKVTASLERSNDDRATGGRSYQVLLGPHNGSTRATLFAGYVPPGRAPWHYHLYDELVWVPEGPGRLHLRDGVEELRAGSAFRLRPREVHIVENTSEDRDLIVLGVFTPAGSPSAAYLAPDADDDYVYGA